MSDLDLQRIAFEPWGGWIVFLSLVAIALALAAWAYGTTAAPLTRPRRVALWGLRGIALLVVLVLLSRPSALVDETSNERPEVAILVDASSSMSLADEGGVTRAEAATRVATELASALDDRYAVTIRPFDHALHAPVTAGVPIEVGPSTASAPGDALEGLMRAARQGPLAAAVLISDGVATRGRDLVTVARDGGVPVFTVALGDSVTAADVRVVGAEAPPAAFVGQPLTIRARVRTTGADAVERIVQLVDEAGEPIASDTVRIAGSGGASEAAFRVTPERAGVRFYRVVAEGAGGDAFSVNDSMHVAVDVRKDRLQVLVLDEFLSWDFMFLRHTLERDTTLAYRYLVKPTDAAPRPLSPDGPHVFPRTASDLAEYKAVILGDLSPGFLSDADWRRLVDYVEAGGGLLVLGGNRAGGLSRLAGTPLSTVLPVAPVGPPLRGEGSAGTPPLSPEVTPLGDAHPLVAIHGDVYGNRDLWADLPPVRPAIGAGAEKPGGEVLVALRGPSTRFPILTVGRAGSGRVVVFAARTPWKWKFVREGVGADDAFFDRFWVGVMRWLADPEPTARFYVRADRDVFRPGDAVTFSGRALAPDLSPLSDGSITATLTSGDTETRLAVERLDGGAIRVSAGELPPGRYAYRVEMTENDGALRQEGEIRVDANGPEWWELSPDPSLLASAARASGGVAVDAADVSELARRITPPLRAASVREIALWNHPIPLAVFLVALALEWWLRRRGGLA